MEETLVLGKREAGGEGGNRGWDGWMASSTQWKWVWANLSEVKITMDWKTWYASVHGVAESDMTEQQQTISSERQSFLLLHFAFFFKRVQSSCSYWLFDQSKGLKQVLTFIKSRVISPIKTNSSDSHPEACHQSSFSWEWLKQTHPQHTHTHTHLYSYSYSHTHTHTHSHLYKHTQAPSLTFSNSPFFFFFSFGALNYSWLPFAGI